MMIMQYRDLGLKMIIKLIIIDGIFGLSMMRRI